MKLTKGEWVRWLGMGLLLVAMAAPATASDLVRAQLDTVGFATSWKDFEAVLTASLAAEDLSAEGPADDPASGGTKPACVAAIIPHDDYLYAGRTAVHALPYLQAPRWIVVGVCHACRRIGLRDQLIFDNHEAWEVAGRQFAVDGELRQALIAGLGELALVDDEHHAQEHSIEALLPWLGAAVPEAVFVPVLVAGMDLLELEQRAENLAAILVRICRDKGWQPGRDLGVLISADAVHYGCEDWGGRNYAPLGCSEVAHAAARAQDITLAQATLAGPLTRAGVRSFTRLVWEPDHPEYPYKITWCGLYSIPFGLSVAGILQADLGGPSLVGELLRYGDSVSDGRLELPETRLGVTADNTLQHWVGYATLVYTPGQ